MIGYSGSGYKGMQLTHDQKTIEGDLFGAFVAAGAISKANADDPKKSSLNRCARTDKGVHAAGNIISLKLIIEDPDIVSKINENLSPQIRVWGIERTNGSFSAYQFCDSRIYEYLIPTHSFLPPHPKSFLGQKIIELNEEANDMDGYRSRQEEVAGFWDEAEEKYIKPVVEQIEPAIRDEVLRFFHNEEPFLNREEPKGDPEEQVTEDVPLCAPPIPAYSKAQPVDGVNDSEIKDGRQVKVEPSLKGDTKAEDEAEVKGEPETKDEPPVKAEAVPSDETAAKDEPTTLNDARAPHPSSKPSTPLDTALRALRLAHSTAKRTHRIPPQRLARIKSTLARFVGSHKFHNYTIDKRPNDPSATRIIKSFVVADTPILIGDTEWLSLKVHGQSFMMHQIRKMVSMAALIVRCGCHEARIQDSYDPIRLSIPKAPSLGLLLERPVFDEYNKKLVEFGREKIEFGRFEGELEAFKQREIYGRIFREEEQGGVFGGFWGGLDGSRAGGLLFLSSLGVEACKRDVGRGEGGMKEEAVAGKMESDDEAGGGEEG